MFALSMGRVQERRNSIAKTLELRLFALAHQYICMLYIIFLIGLNPCGAKSILGNIKV